MVKLYKNDIPSEILNIQGDLAIDTETMGLNLDRDRLCVLQFSFGGGDAYLVQFVDKDYSAPNLRKLLNDSKRQKLFHFARFDVAIIKKYLEVDLQNIYCTKIASKLCRTYTDSHGLKELCRELLGTSISKHQQSSYWGNKELTKDQQNYAAGDVLYLHKLRDRLSFMLERENRLELAQKLFSFLPVRADLDLLGWNEIDIFAHH